MANYLKFAGAVLDKVESGLLTKRITLQLNDAQCRRLLGNLREAHDHFYQSLLFPTHTLHRKCLPFYKEFYCIVKQTEEIVKECSKPDWLEAAIMQPSNPEVFIEMSRKLHFCINGFTQTIQPGLHICSDIALSALNVTVEQHEMDKDFRGDSLKLMERLKEIVNQQVSKDTVIDPRKHQLAEYVIERENYMSSTNAELSTSQPQFYVAKCEYPSGGEPIGSGSAGWVLKVRWLGLECAKKHFGTNLNKTYLDESSSPRKLELMKEVHALMKLNHPNIVKLLCVSMDREVSFLMELMPMSLHNFIQKRWKGQEYVPFTLAAATDIMLQIALGIKYLHGKGVVHRDLKSHNILITPSACEGLSDEGYGHIKVTDFGLSKTLTHDLTEPTGRLGTTCWTAPEVLRLKTGLKPKIDWRKADTYSFAMTCSEMLTGATPFSGGDCTIAMLVERITKGGERPKLPLACPKFLASLLTQCWNRNPDLRPSFTEICTRLQLLQDYLVRGSELIHKIWLPAGFSGWGDARALRRANWQEQDILVRVFLSELTQLKLGTFFRSSKIFRSQVKIPSRSREVSSFILMGKFPQPVGLRGVQVFDFTSSLNYESRKALELRALAKCKYFVEGMKALTENPRNHLVKLQYWHFSSFRDSRQNMLYVVYDAWSNTLDEHLSGLKKTLPWNKRLHILAGFMACVVYFMELIELNVISSISLSTKSILLDKSYNLHFTDVCLVHDAAYANATNGDNPKGMVYEIGIFIMEVLCGIRKHHIDTSDHYATARTQPESPEWVQGLIDPRLNTNYHTGQAGTLLTLGLMCTHPNKHVRPTIWFARDIITSTMDMETKLTRSQVQGQFPALHFFEYNGASEYTCQEVRDITRNFSIPQGFGKYLGILSNGEKVLVELLPPTSASPKSFIDQVKMYTKLPTCGLVMNPIGLCVEEGQRILIYRDMEAMPAQVYLGVVAKVSLITIKQHSEALRAGEDNAKVQLIRMKSHSIALDLARGLNSLCNKGIILHNTTFDNIHVTRNGCVMFGLQFEEENSLTKSEKLSKQMEDFGTILGQLVCGPKWHSTFCTPMHLKNMAVHIEQFLDPVFHNFNNLGMSQLAILASLCLEEGHARLSMVNVIQKLEGMAESWIANAGTLELISSYATLAREFTLHELGAYLGQPGEGESGWLRLEAKLERSGFRQVLAMRQLDRNGFQGYQEPLVEVLLQSLSYHRNLVNLIGYYADSNRLLLLYDCDPCVSLKDRPYDLDWASRMRIAYEVATGLEYLHDKASPPVICGNLNSSNVLYKSTPKLSPFGVADLGQPGSKNDGYCVPECAITGQYTFKSDVYSFGLVLLELITGRRAIRDARATGVQNLVAWERTFLKGSGKNFAFIPDGVDPALFLDVASWCLEQDAAARPPIKVVVSTMQECMVRAGLKHILN